MKTLATLLVSGAGMLAMVNSSPWVMVQKDQLAQLQALAQQNVDNAFTDGASASVPVDSSPLVDPTTAKAPAIQLAATSVQPSATSVQPAGSLSSISQDPSNPLNEPAYNSASVASGGSTSAGIYYNYVPGYYGHHYHFAHSWHWDHRNRPTTQSAVMLSSQRRSD